MISRLASALLSKGWRLVTVESCTGGWIAETATSVAGSSDWFECGLVTYSNDSKTRLAGVPADLIQRYGAVSGEVVCAMTKGALARTNANVAIAVSGVAGPGGGSEEKPVGTVFIAWQFPGFEAHSQRFHFHGDREAVRRQTVSTALEELTRILESSS